MPQFCFVIPVYNHAKGILNTIAKLQLYEIPCLVIDDASDAECAAVIDQLALDYDCVEVLRHTTNRGKGGAVKSGLSRALARGFSHAIQLDADEQHSLTNFEQMLQACKSNPEAVVLGQPVYDSTVPRGRYYGRYATHVWVWINTLSREIPDAMCGFRIYPLAPTVQLLEQNSLGERMDFDIEILVRLSWAGIRFIPVPVLVQYDDENPSHFHYLKDNLRISWLHTKLFFGMLVRLPLLLRRHRRI